MPKYTMTTKYKRPSAEVLRAHPFYQIGRDAFSAGIKCAPALDKRVLDGIAEISKHTPADDRHVLVMTLMDAWSAGFIAAILETPLPENTD